LLWDGISRRVCPTHRGASEWGQTLREPGRENIRLSKIEWRERVCRIAGTAISYQGQLKELEIQKSGTRI
jgi:hypothetical protein